MANKKNPTLVCRYATPFVCHEGGEEKKSEETVRRCATRAFDMSTQIYNLLLFRTYSGNGSGHHISYTNIVISNTYGEDSSLRYSSLRCGWSFRTLRRQFESSRRAATNCLLRNTFATLLHDTRVLLLKDMHVTNGGDLVEASTNAKKILRRSPEAQDLNFWMAASEFAMVAKRLTNLPPIRYNLFHP